MFLSLNLKIISKSRKIICTQFNFAILFVKAYLLMRNNNLADFKNLLQKHFYFSRSIYNKKLEKSY